LKDPAKILSAKFSLGDHRVHLDMTSNLILSNIRGSVTYYYSWFESYWECICVRISCIIYFFSMHMSISTFLLSFLHLVLTGSDNMITSDSLPLRSSVVSVIQLLCQYVIQAYPLEVNLLSLYHHFNHIWFPPTEV
jgi:hypothetical protein